MQAVRTVAYGKELRTARDDPLASAATELTDALPPAPKVVWDDDDGGAELVVERPPGSRREAKERLIAPGQVSSSRGGRARVMLD